MVLPIFQPDAAQRKFLFTQCGHPPSLKLPNLACLPYIPWAARHQLVKHHLRSRYLVAITPSYRWSGWRC